jgi:hypothetical protein
MASVRTVPDQPAVEQAVLALRVALAPGGNSPYGVGTGHQGATVEAAPHGRQHNPAAQDSPLAFLGPHHAALPA